MDELRKQVRDMVDRFADELVNLTIREGQKMVVIRLREARDRARKERFKLAYGRTPREKEGLDMILRLRGEGHSIRNIADTLEKHGFDTPRQGVMWNPGTVSRILKRHGVA